MRPNLPIQIDQESAMKPSKLVDRQQTQTKQQKQSCKTNYVELLEQLPALQQVYRSIPRVSIPCSLDQNGVIQPESACDQKELLARTPLEDHMIGEQVTEAIKGCGLREGLRHLGVNMPFSRANYIHKIKVHLWLEELDWFKEQDKSASFNHLTFKQSGSLFVFQLSPRRYHVPPELGHPVLVERCATGDKLGAVVANKGLKKGKVVLMVRTQGSKLEPDEEINLTFLFDRTNYIRYHDSVDALKSWPEWRWCMLLPDTIPIRYLDPLIELPSTHDKKLSSSQNEAIEAILASRCRPRPYIIIGPPGTGKSRTVIESIAQIHEKMSAGFRILAVSNTNRSVDALATHFVKLKPHLAEKSVRLMSHSANHERRKQGYIDPALEDISMDKLSVFKQLSTLTIFFTTCSSAYILKNLQIEFNFVFIDEASQVTEPEALIAINLMSIDGSLVLAGDIKQLGPYRHSFCSIKGLEKSLMERILSTSAYKSSYDEWDNKLVAMLSHCFRSDERLLKVNNTYFYDDRLKFHVETPTNWMHKLSIKSPSLYVNVPEGKHVQQWYSYSFYNVAEAERCRDLVGLFTRTLGVAAKDVAVITPYYAQAKLIRKLLRANNLDDCTVSPIECFQGDERDIIIVSLVRTHLQGSKFAFSLRRSNVATSRARFICCLVCNVNEVRKSNFWREYIAAAEELALRKFL